jgi:hypothetical protein
MHDYLTRLEALRHHREELLEEAEIARLGREVRRGRGVADKSGGMGSTAAEDPGV